MRIGCDLQRLKRLIAEYEERHSDDKSYPAARFEIDTYMKTCEITEHGKIMAMMTAEKEE